VKNRRSENALAFEQDIFSHTKRYTPTMKHSPVSILNLIVMVAALTIACTSSPSLGKTSAETTLIAAGDIASCDETGDEQTAKLIQSMLEKTPATVAALGDLVYPTGKLETYKNCYGPSWGQFLKQTKAAIGNHDYSGGTSQDYYTYFRAAAGPNPDGYYSYDLGTGSSTWHVIVLNSNCWAVGGCETGSKQYKWLQQDLEKNQTKNQTNCTIAYWHHPRFSSALHGNNEFMQDVWALLANGGVEVILNGHDHDYERFAPLNAAGKPSEKGTREFVVGTGGKNTYPFLITKPGSQVRKTGVFGVLELKLKASSYDWRFVPVAGKTFTDSGSTNCH
jgi:acid phosphatase type 7